MKRVLPLLALYLFSMYPLIQIAGRGRVKASEDAAEQGALLPTAASDVIIVVADFSSLPGDLLDRPNLAILREIDGFISALPGLRGSSSLLNATVVKAEQDEILSLPFVSGDLEKLTLAREQYQDFPEIWPYLSRDFQTGVFYLEPGLTYPAQSLIGQLEALQRETHSRYGVQLDFTGLRPVRTYLERYLTQDLLKTLPIMFLLISLVYFLAFGNWYVMAVAWMLKVGITTFAFACYSLFARRISPMVILIPTFNFGLLSDYVLHMGYHLQGRSGLHSWRSVRKHLLVPLTLASMTSMVGFLSLVTLGGEGHLLLAVTVGISFAMIYVFALWWLPGVIGPRLEAAGPPRPLVRWWSRATDRVFALIFFHVYNNRRVVLPVLLVLAVVAAVFLLRLQIQPYPLKQLPDSATVVKAERLLNDRFSGTVPFRLEIEASQGEAFLHRESLRALEGVQGLLGESPDVGYQRSILSVVKRINYYFHDSDPQFLAIPGVQDDERFVSLIQQYLLFYSASASPDEYESLIDAGFTTVSLHGILRYRDSSSLADFQRALDRITSSAPPDWRIRLSGPLLELIRIKTNMERNWYFTFGFGTILIFVTVLIFFRNVRMSLISLVPSFCILLVLAGVAPLLNIQVDEYTIVIVGVSTGLTIDYTIHMLNTMHRMIGKTRRSWRSVRSFGYALVRSGGQPVFLSLLTTILAFVTLFVSSFTGAVHFAFLLCLAIGSAFLISVFLLPLFFVARLKIPLS